MSTERKTGVFGSVVSENTHKNEGESVTVVLKSVGEDSPDSIYNLIFSEYDEEKHE